MYSMDVFDAISDPVRRSILQRLNGAPGTAGEIAAGYSISRPAVSRHLRVLREAGLISAEASGREQIYRIERERLTEIDKWLRQFRVSLPAVLDALETEVYRARHDHRERLRTEPSKEEQSA